MDLEKPPKEADFAPPPPPPCPLAGRWRETVTPMVDGLDGRSNRRRRTGGADTEAARRKKGKHKVAVAVEGKIPARGINCQ